MGICWPQVCFVCASNEVKGKKNKTNKASLHLCKLSNDFFGLSNSQFLCFLWVVRCKYITLIAVGYECMRECKSVGPQYIPEFFVIS